MNELTDERLAELRKIAEETRVRRIAPFNPPTMLALLDEVERLREELDDMQLRLNAANWRETMRAARLGTFAYGQQEWSE